MTSFFRDPNGKPSMTRLCAFLLTVAALGVGAGTVWYVLRRPPRADVIFALSAVVGAFVASGAVAIFNRVKAK